MKKTQGDWSMSGMWIVNKKQSYEWDCERMSDSAGVLDFIVQLSKKTWSTVDCVRDAIKLLDRVFNIQGSWCGGGQHRTKSAAKAAEATAQMQAEIAASPLCKITQYSAQEEVVAVISGGGT